MTVTITCRGYIDWFGYVYNDETEQISVTVSDKLEDVIDADPNNLFSSTASSVTMDENMVLASKWEDQNRTAKTIIDELVSFGGGSDDRWLFGIYANRIIHFNQAPMAVDYVYYQIENAQRIETVFGEVVLSVGCASWQMDFNARYYVWERNQYQRCAWRPAHVLCRRS